MKKHFGIKPFVIAAAIMTTGAVSVIGASAATTRNVSDLTATAVITEQPEAPASPITPEEPAAPTAPEDPVQPDISAPTDPTENTDQPDTYLKKLSEEEAKEHERKFNEKGESEIFRINGKKMKWIVEKFSDMEFLGEDSDGTRHYKSRICGRASVLSANSLGEDEYSTYLLVAVD